MAINATEFPAGEVIDPKDLEFSDAFRARATKELTQIQAVANLYAYRAEEGTSA